MLHEFPTPVAELSSPRWRVEYESAKQEVDHIALFKRIEIAEAAILTRREVLTLSSNDFVEWQQIERALHHLRHLKKEVLKFC